MVDAKLKKGNDVKILCDQCIFGVHYTADGKLTRICVGFEEDVTIDSCKDRHERIIKASETGSCDMYDEGHKLWLKMDESGLGPSDFLCGISGEEMHIYDKTYSKDPTFVCTSGAHSGYKLGHCPHGDGTYCYWKNRGCTSQHLLDNPDKMADDGTFKNALEAAGIDISKIKALNQGREIK